MVWFWFGLVRFYGISSIQSYLIPNPFYTYKQFYFKHYSLVLAQLLFTLSEMYKQFYFKQFSLT